jgi:hypothetical protein
MAPVIQPGRNNACEETHMEYIGLIGGLGIVLLAGAWWLSRLMLRGGRNEGSTHGGGIEGAPPEAR